MLLIREGPQPMLIRRSGTQVIGEQQAPRMPGQVDLASAGDFSLGPLSVQPSTLQVQFADERRTIEPRVMQVLVLLAGERGTVVSRDTLIECCWAGRIVSEDAINRCIAKARRLGEESHAFEIETIPRVGYRLIPAETTQQGTVRPPRSRLPLMAALAAIALLALAGGVWLSLRSPAAPEPKIAVLPFIALDTRSGGKDLGASIATDVANALAQTGARVLNKVGNLDDARRAGAQMIISGTIEHDGEGIRVTTRVDSVRTGSTLLSNEFQADAAQAGSMGGRVAGWLVPPVRMWSSFLGTERDPVVTDEIMRIFLTKSSVNRLRAWDLSRSLAKVKPRSGSAQFVTALLTSDVLPMIAPDQRPTAIDAARQAARHAAALLGRPERAAVVLDCHLTAPGWQVLTPRCDQATRRAISADPDIPVVPVLFGMQLADAGRFAEAAKFIDMDLAENPLGLLQLDRRIFVTRLSRGGDADDVLPQLVARMHRYTAPTSLAGTDFNVAVANGDWHAAEALFNNPEVSENIAVADARATLQVAFRALQSKAPADITALRSNCDSPQLSWTPGEPGFSMCLAALTALGDLDGAFATARRGYRDVSCCSPAEQERQWLATGGDYFPRWVLFGKATAPLRADRRFIEIARRTGLLAYWKSGHPPDFCSFERVPVCDILRAR